jgi:PPOX class probable F420-dependent enzyme
MGVRLSEEEAWEFVTQSRTGILTTLRSDGYPVSLPIWFVVLDGAVYTRTPAKAKKVARVRNDPRASFCVESGDRWVELKAVVWTGAVSLVDDDALRNDVLKALGEKYAGYGVPMTRVPDATKRHYADTSAVIRFVPEGRFLTWDNARLRLSD